MQATHQRDIIWPTPKGDVQTRSFCTPEEIQQFTFDRGLRQYAHYKSLYIKKESLEKDARQEDANVTLALVKNKNIIGYGVLAYPKTDARWKRLGARRILELKAIEVCRSWRSLRVADSILQMLMVYPKIEDKIVFLVGYSWTWDLKWTKHSPKQYRNMLIRLFEPHGFKEYPTNEPNVNLRAENMLLARIGENVSSELQDRFKWARYGLNG